MAQEKSSVVVCLGLPGSASTWIFNICAELLMSSYESVHSMYAENFSEFLATIDTSANPDLAFVIKSHFTDEDFSRCVTKDNVKCILSIRDPRDCIVSMMDRFFHSFEFALSCLLGSCNSLLRLREFDVPLFRYEDMFFESQQTIVEIHKYLQLPSKVDFEELYRSNCKESVMTFIEKFDEMPKERIQKLNEFDSYDVSTHWHTRHFGDGQSGKWKSRFSAEQKLKIHQTLGPALEALGYCNTLGDQVTDGDGVGVPMDLEFSVA